MIRLYSKQQSRLWQSKAVLPIVTIVFLFWLTPNLCAVSIPDWLRQLANQPLPTYKAETDGVILLDEEITTVKDNGEITLFHRMAYKILRPSGKELGLVVVPFDKETKLTYLKGWSISAKGEEYEVKEKDAIETGLLSESLYEDTKHKILKIPASDVGAIVGYEYEQRQRPYVLQNEWHFQHALPTRKSRFSLRLPSGWEFENYWANHGPIQPQSPAAGQTTWEIDDVPEIETESSMPHWRSIAGRMVLNYFPRKLELKDKVHTSWNDVGAWSWQLVSSQRDSSPEIKQRVTEMTTGARNSLDKIRALGTFVQRDIRYVAIEIGIGGYQPHLASEVFKNRFGDCKDKATLLSSMLREIGVESYYVLINSERGYLKPEIPSALSFNHVILAIKVPADVDTRGFMAVMDHPKLGKLLFFDPTSERTALGYLPASEQENYGLILTENGGDLQKLALLPPETNKLIRTAKLELTPEGTLSGTVEEVRAGSFASGTRARLLEQKADDRAKVLESFLGGFLGSFRLTKASVANLEDNSRELILNYSFVATGYAKNAGPLLLVKPRVLGEKSDDVLETGKERKYPVEFDDASVQRDIYEITVPNGYEADELPDPLQIKLDFAEYSSKTELTANTLKYSREFIQRQVFVPLEGIPNLRKFYRQISAEERSSAVLKKSVPK